MSHEYDLLPPIVIQGSYNIDPLTDKKDEELLDQMIFNKTFGDDAQLIVSIFESPDEVLMKNYLLQPSIRLHKSTKV